MLSTEQNCVMWDSHNACSWIFSLKRTIKKKEKKRKKERKKKKNEGRERGGGERKKE